MSATFYELLKYAKTGVASPGMTGSDKQKALALFGGGGEPKPKVRYVYVGADGKCYRGTDGTVYTSKRKGVHHG